MHKLIIFALLAIAGSTQAAEFKFVGDDKFFSLRMQGKIERGDFDRLIIELSQADSGRIGMQFFHQRRALLVNSPGGSVEEALRIANFVKQAMIPVWVLGRCESACFLILAAAVERTLDGSIGVHRPYFADDAAQGMSPEETRRAYSELSSRFYRALEDYEVPRQIADKMRVYASTEMYYLNQSDKELLGRRQPWFEQLLISRCKLDKQRESDFLRELTKRIAANETTWRAPEDFQEYSSKVQTCTNESTYKARSEAYFQAAESLLNRIQPNTTKR